MSETKRKPYDKDGVVETATGADVGADVGAEAGTGDGIDALGRGVGTSDRGMETSAAWSTGKEGGSSVAAAVAGFAVGVAAAGVDIASSAGLSH